ncbi:MAG: hypothetical protein U5J63_09670 [Fodinibius sp.]|nr:hypothetical protein [Fodinibius sp.]
MARPISPKKRKNGKKYRRTNSVPADGILETVTWNLLGYGTGFTGPANTDQQTQNIVQVINWLMPTFMPSRGA